MTKIFRPEGTTYFSPMASPWVTIIHWKIALKRQLKIKLTWQTDKIFTIQNPNALHCAELNKALSLKSKLQFLSCTKEVSIKLNRGFFKKETLFLGSDLSRKRMLKSTKTLLPYFIWIFSNKIIITLTPTHQSPYKT